MRRPGSKTTCWELWGACASILPMSLAHDMGEMGVLVRWKDQRAAETGSQVSREVFVRVDTPTRPLIWKGGKRSLT